MEPKIFWSAYKREGPYNYKKLTWSWSWWVLGAAKADTESNRNYGNGKGACIGIFGLKQESHFARINHFSLPRDSFFS